MSDHGVLPGLWPIQGDGVLARQGDLVLLIHPAGGPLTDRLLNLLTEAAKAGETGARFVDLVSATFDADAATAETAGDELGPAAVAFGPAGRGTAVVIYGTAWAEVTAAHGKQRVTTGQPYGRVRCVLPSELIEVRAGVKEAEGESDTDPYLRLAEGVVRAVALVYAPEGARADTADVAKPEPSGRLTPLDVAQAAPPAHAPPAPTAPASLDVAQAAPSAPVPASMPPTSLDVAQAGMKAANVQDAGQAEEAVAAGGQSGVFPKPDFISLSLTGTSVRGEVPPRSPLPLGAEQPDQKDLAAGEESSPLVDGIYCKNGHFNDPEARYCAVCGIGMAQLTKVGRKDRRPPLGVLVLPDGSVCQLDADYVMGREPTLDTSVANGSARPLRLPSAGGMVSRIHARLDLDGWQVYISDLNSVNGTQVVLPGETTGKALQPGVRTPLVAGAQIRLGGEYGLRYDSHRHR